ncbi:LysR substrate-binding domain-containing protein [Ralstonia sp. CHL-2022]|uniref:LysR substrate-binding domain-containing protein n=1 Tax=Ralstonia mojiangensis TaxID=2953895 RepID=A0ABT2LC53_9RALS|nr:LysR substrate-binding domain-containing protein [Ralstonia mojiangensis]MCT7313017.1 LysR substrate-binding domain-containing protein [Ralstonia mojiangensis]
MTMEARQIEAFRAAAVHGGFTKGAEALGITQPALTRAIARLETGIGFPLFERGHGPARLTPEGAAFLREVERRFVGIDQLRRIAQDIRNFGTGRLRITCMQVFANGVVPAALQRFKEAFPEVTVSLQVRPSATVYEWVAGGRCDIGIAGPKSGFLGVDEEPFLSLAGVLAAPSGHRFGRLRRAVVPADLDGEPFLALALEDGTRHVIDQIFSDAHIHPAVQIETQYAETLCSLVARGLGVAIVNPVLAAEVKHLPIVMRRFEPHVRFESRLLWPATQPRTRVAEAFVACMREEAMRSLRALPYANELF